MKFRGIKIASFIVGVIIPIVAIMFLLGRFTVHEPEVVVTYTPLKASVIDTFVVDYDMYGTMNVGDEVLQVTVNNNSANLRECKVWITVDGETVTDVTNIECARSIRALPITFTKTVPGEYKAKLIYEVGEEGNSSRVTCPFVILLNGGT